MNTANYDATLTGWAAQNVQTGRTLGATGRTYCTAVAARNTLTTTKGWTINGDALLCPPNPAFITTWVTTDNTITIPTTGTGYNYTVIWENLTNAGAGNGSVTGQTGSYTITGLTNNDTYRVSISGNFPRFFMNNNGTERTKLRTIEQWGNIAWTSMQRAFRGCENLTYNATDAPNLSGVTDMSFMFSSCTNFNGDIGNWNTSNVTRMQEMFRFATSFNQNINGWNTSNVTNMSWMFQGATNFNQPLGNWNTQNVTDMRLVFGQATSFNQNIGNWNTQSVTNMGSMFSGATSFNQDIGNWNTNNVTNMNGLFRDATSFNQNLASWNVENVADFSFMLSNCGMNTANYDAILISWAAQNVQTGRVLNAGGLTYCTAVAARNTLTTAKGWTINDSGLSCPTLPEINLQGNGVTIANGSNSPNAANNTDFGNVAECNNNTVSKTFTIQNTGAANLSVTGITITGTNAADFALSGLPTFPATVAPSGSQTFTVTFDPSAIGNRTATISIANNDATANPYTFTIQGTGTVDNTNPAVPTLANVTAQCSVTSLTAPTTTDNCSGTITGTTTQTFPITTQGTTVVTWTFTDAAGNSVTANQNVVINDNTNPVVPTLADVTAACSVPSLTAPTTTDNCSGTITGTTTQTFPITSSTTVTWTFDDGNGNVVTANQNVIISDNTNPVIPTLADVTDQCSVASLTPPTTTDNCSGTVTGTTTQTFPITSTTTVVWTFTDAAGNSVTANQNVIINDNTNPAVPTLADVTAQCSVTSLTPPTTTDNCSGTVTGTTTQTLPITTQGTTVVTWTFTDASGNSVTATQNVIINDNTNPVIPTLADVTAQCSVTSLTPPTTTDNCSGTITGTTTQTFPITTQGTTVVTWTFTDAAGNSVTANQNVIINDNTNPTITAPTNVTVTVDAGLCTASGVTLGTATGADNCGTVTFSNNAPSVFPIGTTTVTWTANDANGNTATATQTVTVVDNRDINLTGNGVTIASGSLTASTTNDTDFGTVTGATTKTYTLQNTGTQNVTITSITSNNASFVVSNAPTVVLAGNSATFDVEFSTTNTGVATAVITVLNNDCNASSYQFTVRANLQSASAPTTPTSPVQVNLNLTAVSVSPTNINLTWTPDSRISSYRLFRNDQPITTLTGNVSSYSDENLTADTFYRYRLVGIANGTETNPALAETWTLPNAPTLVSVTTLCGGGIAKATLESNTFRYKVYATQDATTPILESNGNATFELPSISTTTTFYVSVLGRDTRQERESARTPVTVTVEPIFEAKIIGNATQLSCENTLELQAQEVENATYTWLLNGSNTGVTGRTITANSGGEYQVRIQKGSCSFTSPSVTVRLNQTPIARIAQANNSRFCDTGTLSAVATSSDLNYEWRVNTTVIGQNQSIEVSQSEVYTLIVTNSNNCQASTQIEVFVTQTPSLPVIVATENTICPTTETTLSVQNPENNVVYQWFRNGRSIRQEGSSISTSVQGNYQVRAVASQNTACDAISEELEINVVEVTPVYLRTSENNTALFVEDANGSQNEIASVEWYFEGDLKADLGSQNEITPTENGNYSAKVTNQNGCVIQTRTVYFRIAEPTIITGNEELKADKLNIYPNPNNGIFNIQFATALSENTEITIFDGIGRKVFTQTIERGNQATQINLQKIPSGVYLIRFNQNEATYTKQIIVE